MREVVHFTYIDDEGNEVEVDLPARYEVCPRCEGRGTHVDPRIDGNGITSEEWARDFDEDEKELYLTGGYDVPCHRCDGHRVILVVDRDRCKPEILARYDEDAAEDAHYERLCKMEREMGA